MHPHAPRVPLMNLRPEILRQRPQADQHESQTRQRDAGARKEWRTTSDQVGNEVYPDVPGRRPQVSSTVLSSMRLTDSLIAVRLIPFALIIIIAEEVIPLVVMYAPFILPSTCILPSQKERIDAKKRDKIAAYASEMTQVFEAIRQRGLADSSADAGTLLSGSGVTAVGG